MNKKKFILKVEKDEWRYVKYKIIERRKLSDKNVMISDVSEWYDREFKELRKIGERGKNEINEMKNDRGLNIILNNDKELR